MKKNESKKSLLETASKTSVKDPLKGKKYDDKKIENSPLNSSVSESNDDDKNPIIDYHQRDNEKYKLLKIKKIKRVFFV